MRPDQRQAVGGAGTRADPLVGTRVPVDSGQHRRGRVDDRLDPARVERGVRLAELHHSGDPEPVAERRGRHPLRREVDRCDRHVLGLHREAVAAAGLDDRRDAEVAGQRSEPGAGRDHHGVGAQRHTAPHLELHADVGVADVAYVGVDDLGATTAYGIGKGMDEATRVDESLIGEPNTAGHSLAERRHERVDLVAVEQGVRGLPAELGDVVELVDQLLPVRLRGECGDERLGRLGRFAQALELVKGVERQRHWPG